MGEIAVKLPKADGNDTDKHPLPEMLQKYLEAPRYQIKRNISQFLFAPDKTTPLSALVIEVSQFSFGILSRASLDRGDTYHLKIPPLSTVMPLEVIWSEQSQNNPGYWQSGLQLQTCNVNLLTLFVKAGLLKTKVPTPAEGRALVTFSHFATAVSELHTHTSQLLAETGHKDLMGTHKSYGFRVDPSSFAILMLKTLKPKELLQMNAYEAAKSMMVFREERGSGFETTRWIKVWPSYGCIEERFLVEDKESTRSKVLNEVRITDVANEDLQEKLAANADQDIEIDL